MLPIQIFILLLLAFSLLLSILILRNRLLGRLFFGVQFLVGAVLIMLFYITALAFTARIRRMERNQTLMVRSFAIENAKKPVDCD